MKVNTTYIFMMMLVVTALWHQACGANFVVNSSTYLGNAGTTETAGAALAADNTIYWGGTITTTAPFTSATTVLGGTNGTIMHLSATGRDVLSTMRIGVRVNDLAVCPDGQVVVCGSFGVAVVNAALTQVTWSKSLNGGVEAQKVAIGTDGVLAVLAAGNIYVFDRANNDSIFIAQANSYTNDIAVCGLQKMVVITGFNNKKTGRGCGSFTNCPVQVAFIKAFSYNGTPAWTDYDWPGSWMDGQDPDHNQAGNIMSDTRGYVIAVGADGYLYYGGETAGGNSMYLYSPTVFGAAAPFPKYDAHSNAYNAASDHITFIGRIDPSDGSFMTGQFLIARDVTTKTNTTRPRGLSIDVFGLVNVAGLAEYAISDRNNGSVNGTLVHKYSVAEPHLCLMDLDNSKRMMWTVFTADSMDGIGWGNATAISDSVAVMSAYTRGQLVTTTQSLQPALTASTITPANYLVSSIPSLYRGALTVRISQPVNFTGIGLNIPITVVAEAQSSAGAIDSVVFYVDTVRTASDNSAPYSMQLLSGVAGKKKVYAKAYDHAGNVRKSVPVTVTVSGSSSIAYSPAKNNNGNGCTVVGNIIGSPENLSIRINLDKSCNLIVSVYDYAGHKLYSKHQIGRQGNNRLLLNGDTMYKNCFAPGVYCAVITIEGYGKIPLKFAVNNSMR